MVRVSLDRVESELQELLRGRKGPISIASCFKLLRNQDIVVQKMKRPKFFHDLPAAMSRLGAFDLDILDCSICMEHLSPHVYQVK